MSLFPSLSARQVTATTSFQTVFQAGPITLSPCHPPEQSHFSDVKKFSFIPPHPRPPHSLWYCCGGLLPYQAPLGCGYCFCSPCWGADRKGKSRHWSLMGALRPLLAARCVSPWVQKAPRCPVPPWGSSVHVQGCGSSAPALGAHIIFSPSTGGQPSQTGFSQASGSPAASALLGTESPVPGPGPVGVGRPLWTLSVASDLAAPARLPIFQGSRQASCLVPELPQIQGPLSRTLSSPRPVVPQLHVHWPPAQPGGASLVWRQIARHHVGGTGRSTWAVEALRFLSTSSLHCDVLGEASGVSSAPGPAGGPEGGVLVSV